MSKHTSTPWQTVDSVHDGRCHIATTGDTPRSIALCQKEEDAEFILRACNSHDALERIAELALSAVKHRNDKDWALMHLDLSEAAELAAGVQP